MSPHCARFDLLPPGAVVGTSSLRRTVLLKALRTDLQIEPLSGNLDTRLRKLDEGRYAGIVLPTAVQVFAERGVSRTMGGSCAMPLAAHATLSQETLTLHAAWGDPQAQNAPSFKRKGRTHGRCRLRMSCTKRLNWGKAWRNN